MSMSQTPFSCKQLSAIGQDLGQLISQDPMFTTNFLARLPPTTPGPATTPGSSSNPQANPPHHCRNPHTMPMSTHHPQQAINSIPSMNEPHITATLTIPDAITSHVIGHAGTGLRQIHDFSHAKVAVSSHVGPSASHAITIRGSPRKVGDALITVGCRIAKRRIRPPCQR